MLWSVPGFAPWGNLRPRGTMWCGGDGSKQPGSGLGTREKKRKRDGGMALVFNGIMSEKGTAEFD